MVSYVEKVKFEITGMKPIRLYFRSGTYFDECSKQMEPTSRTITLERNFDRRLVINDKTEKKNSTSVYEWSLNPVDNAMAYIVTPALTRLLKFYVKITGKDIQCHACGGWIAKWSISDPNINPENTRKRWRCCDWCVNFYDMHCSKRRLKEGENGRCVKAQCVSAG